MESSETALHNGVPLLTVCICGCFLDPEPWYLQSPTKFWPESWHAKSDGLIKW